MEIKVVEEMEVVSTAEEKDTGFLLLKGTIAKDAVFEMKGRQLKRPGDPEKIYKVHRSMEAMTTEETVKTIESAPLLFGHQTVTCLLYTSPSPRDS